MEYINADIIGKPINNIKGVSKAIIVVDIETQGLDARKFLCASLVKESGKKLMFYDKEKLWKYILKLGRIEQRNKRVLNVYSHNAQYDFYGYANLEDKGLRFLSFRPFIANYIINNKKAINFLDSMAILGKTVSGSASLKEMGKMIGLEKLEMPNEFLTNEKITKERLKELAPYCIRDSEIVMKFIKIIKKKLSEEGINIRRLYTINQIAIGYFINWLKYKDEYEKLFFKRHRGIIEHTKFKTKIHEAYRGGLVRCFKTGKVKNVTYIDCNNLYGYASTQIRFPDLKTERIMIDPLKIWNTEELVKHIGISKCLIYNKRNKFGLLPIRTNVGNYFPTDKKYLIGTWTHIELKKAIEEGYEIKNIEWSIIYDEHKNPFRELTPKLYKKRKGSKTEFDNWFYKQI